MKDISQLVTSVRSFNPGTQDYDYTFSFTFNSKETYLEFRSAWKQAYKEHSAKIRNTKAEIKTLQKAGKIEAAGLLQSQLHGLRREARRLLRMREASKVEAQKQYKADKALPPSAPARELVS